MAQGKEKLGKDCGAGKYLDGQMDEKERKRERPETG